MRVALLCAALLGCAGAAPPAHAPAASPAGAIAHGEGRLSAERVRAIGAAVSRLRALPFRVDVPVSFVDAPTFEKRVVEALLAEATPTFLDELGELTPEETFRKRARFLLAVYAPKRREVFVRATLPEGWSDPDLEGLLAHELVHALQFQHFDPYGIRAARKSTLDVDGLAALDAFLEGEAELVAAGFLAERRGGQPRRSMVELGRSRSLDTHVFAVVGRVNDALSKASSSEQATQLFPYQFGPYFCAALFRTGGTKLLDAAWASPPATSREIFEPKYYLQPAHKLTMGAAPLLPYYDLVGSLPLGAYGFYRLAQPRAVKLATKTAEEVLELSTHVVADRLTFTASPFGTRPLFAAWAFDDAAHAKAAADLFEGTTSFAVADRFVLVEGAPDKLLAGLPERYAAVPLTPAPVAARPQGVLAALPDSAKATVANAGGLHLDPELTGAALPAGPAWIDHRQGDRGHAFLSVLGDGVTDPGELTAAFKKGLVLDKADVVRTPLPAQKQGSYTFSIERLEWTVSGTKRVSALVGEAKACGGGARVMVTLAPAGEPSELLSVVRGWDGLERSPYCTKVAELVAHDLP